ncbi:MAG: DsbA family oxidoreductase [Tissierellia bacterium]|jgi:predicted DsbA family dithiol-disulfide isomerase|nr:DsbA family oxidoreductase [Tissierellia bacterium]
MKIQIFADFICPYCYVRQKQLRDAINEVDPSIEIEIMSYELAPGAIDNNDLKMADVFVDRFGMSPEEMKANTAQVNKMIQEAGLEINSDDLKYSNTLKAHTLLQYAKEQKLANALADEIYHAYFAQGAYLNKDESLIEIASKVGMDKETVNSVIGSKEYINKVHADHSLGKKIGINTVPHVVIDGELSVSGTQSKESYKEAINKVMANK